MQTEGPSYEPPAVEVIGSTTDLTLIQGSPGDTNIIN